MTTQNWDISGEASVALRAVVKDHGVAALSDPQFMNSLLGDFIPGSQRELRILVAAAEADVASILRDRTAQHISTASAVAQAAAVLEERSALTPSACQWAASQMALALGLPQQSDPGPAPISVPPSTSAPPVSAPPVSAPPTPVPTRSASPAPAKPVPTSQRQPSQQSGRSAATVAAGAALACALSLLLQLLQPFSLGAADAWLLALSGLTVFGGAALTLGARSRYCGTGVIFGATLALASWFIGLSVGAFGAAEKLAAVVTTVAALIAAGAAAAFFARDGRLSGGNLRQPLVAAFCAAAAGYVIAYIPGWDQFPSGTGWITPPGLIGPGVHGKFLFAGIVGLAAIAIPVVMAGLLAPRTGAQAGVIAGWLLVNGASLFAGALTAGQPGIRAGSALYISAFFWVVAVALGIALLASARTRAVSAT